MKLEIGKYYRTRDGRKVGPSVWDGPGNLPWELPFGGGSYRYGENGNAAVGRECDDLISEWHDEPCCCTMAHDGECRSARISGTGTLAELDVKPGDVVEWCSEVVRHWHVTVSHDWDKWTDKDIPQWRIISRAQPIPVRTVTRTTKEIVPGVYGDVWVDTNVSGGFNVGFNSYSATADDLTAAIETLTAIKEAME